MKSATKTVHEVWMHNPHQCRTGGSDVRLRANSRKALDKKAAEFAQAGCTIKWDTYTTDTVER